MNLSKIFDGLLELARKNRYTTLEDKEFYTAIGYDKALTDFAELLSRISKEENQGIALETDV